MRFKYPIVLQNRYSTRATTSLARPPKSSWWELSYLGKNGKSEIRNQRAESCLDYIQFLGEAEELADSLGQLTVIFGGFGIGPFAGGGQ